MGDPTQARRADSTLRRVASEHLVWMRGRGYAEASIEQRRRCLDDLVRWLGSRRCTQVGDVKAHHLDAWASDLAARRRTDGGALALSTRANLIYAIRGFFRAARARGVITVDPASDLRVVSPPPPLPRAIPAVPGILRILDAPDLRTTLGRRDRAMLELLYAAGVRRGELVRLQVQDVDVARERLFVRRGKGGRDRVLPIGPRAARWVERYLKTVRPRLAAPTSGAVLFLGRNGRALRPNTLGDRLRPYVRSAAPAGSCHVFRHACATHMLEGGADIRFVQEMLGHARLTTTQVYTRVSIDALTLVHAATHPSSVLSGSASRRMTGSRRVEMHGLFRLPCRGVGERHSIF